MNMSLSQYLKNREKRLYTSFVVNSSGHFYMENNVLIPAAEFEKMYPLDVKIKADNGKGENPNRRKTWGDY